MAMSRAPSGVGNRRAGRRPRPRNGGRNQLAQEVLLQQSRLRTYGEVAAGVAHDVSNVITALALRVQAMRSRHAHQPVVSELEVLSRLVAEGSTLIRRLQVVDPRPPGRPRATDLAAEVRAAIELAETTLRVRAAAAGATVRLSVDIGDVPPVVAVPEALRHAVVNLLLNAGDAMPKGGQIRIAASTCGRRVRLAIQDEGSGIPAEILPRVFDLFFSTKGERGSGIGLAVVRATVEAVGGHVSARNRPGGGACFALELLRAHGRLPAPHAGPAPFSDGQDDPRPSPSAAGVR
jgi:signal transduction histidine kinase